jgi:type IV secretory pathway component VirB8
MHHGKQKRTETRKEKTEEAKSLVAKASSNPRHEWQVHRRLVRAPDSSLPVKIVKTSKRISVPHPSRPAKDEDFGCVSLPALFRGGWRIYIPQNDI